MQIIEVQEMLLQIIKMLAKKESNTEWLTLKEGAKYAGVSYNTLIKFRLKGLKIAEVDSLKRISKTEIDNFFKEYSF
ncbi:DNA-binding protein [Planococcus sp. YIM B11945]|uniref:DNA-binding protein n=1 Tax=Planococcus sp. YIM B11945 TaxID=3435410 RepID=UPI003D7EEA80